MALQESIDFVVGGEKYLTDVLSEAEVIPLLKSAAQAGLELAAVVDAAGAPLWTFGQGSAGPGPSVQKGSHVEFRPIYLAGELVGKVYLAGGEKPAEEVLKILAQVVAAAVNSMVQTNLKRMMVTEIHTQVVQLSYDELLETNRRLTESEQKYRELAESLEIRVQERTAELKQVYTRMLQQEKMASVGQLAAGMAHEINNPLSFILSNLKSLEKYVGRFVELVGFYEEQSGVHDYATFLNVIREKRSNLKIDFILEDLGELFAQTVLGAERVKKIVEDLRGFSHVDTGGDVKLDINLEIERTLSVLSSEIPADAEIIKKLAALPELSCKVPLLCQAFLNIIRNAFQASPRGLKLGILTELDGHGRVRIVFEDNGPGIPHDVQRRIFEPFFTTRDVGAGMGMGLTVAYEVVTSCGGTIDIKSKEGEGAVFVITLPIGVKT
jgi:two-component system, NtrC family, sensor kinase